MQLDKGLSEYVEVELIGFKGSSNYSSALILKSPRNRFTLGVHCSLLFMNSSSRIVYCIVYSSNPIPSLFQQSLWTPCLRSLSGCIQNKDRQNFQLPHRPIRSISTSSSRLIGGTVNWQLHCASEWKSRSATTRCIDGRNAPFWRSRI